MRADADILKYPCLRSDLKISKQVLSGKVTHIVKDPVKNTYFKFEDGEWAIISLFDGSGTLKELVQKYEKAHSGMFMDLQSMRDYQESLNGIHLLEKPTKEQNIMLIEKMKEVRGHQLLSKKGSILYKRFPLIDPDKLFDKVIPYIRFFWTKAFFVFALLCMALAAGIVVARWQEFHVGVFDVFSFSKHSFFHLFILWVTIYVTIAIHELGHGLTCKYYGGEVHEIGLLLMFFQPCLYANVNDAWLFDKKWKQLMVTLAGGFIEVWVGTLFTFVWALSNSGTFLNTLSFQVMTICFASTVLFNFNPLIKLDGYYLLADFCEIPNLRENSFKYVQYWVSKYIFRLQKESFEATKREKRIFFIYGVSATLWVTSLLFGLFSMAKNLLTQHFHEVGVLISLFIAYKLFFGHIKKGSKFLMGWVITKRAWIQSFIQKPNVKIGGAILAVLFLGFLFIPLGYSVPGECVLEASFMRVLRAKSDGLLTHFYKHDGEVVETNEPLLKLENYVLDYDRKIASLAVEKLKYKLMGAYDHDVDKIAALQKELRAKQTDFQYKSDKVSELVLTYKSKAPSIVLLSCSDEIKKTHVYLKKGEEICRLLGIQTLKAVVQFPESQVRFVKEKDRVEFKLKSAPLKTYHGKVNKMRVLSQSSEINPKEKLYQAEILIDNPGELRPGMSGVSKIIAEPVSLLKNVGRKLTSFFRLDLFI